MAILNYNYVNRTTGAAHTFDMNDWPNTASKLLVFQEIYNLLCILPVRIAANIDDRVILLFVDANDDICSPIMEII